MKIDICI